MKIGIFGDIEIEERDSKNFRLKLTMNVIRTRRKHQIISTDSWVKYRFSTVSRFTCEFSLFIIKLR